jgi:hypothetical protein
MLGTSPRRLPALHGGIVAVALVALGCGATPPDGTVAVTGTVAGKPAALHAALASVVPVQGGSALAIVLTGFSNACAHADVFQVLHGTTTLVFTLYVEGPTADGGLAVTPGTGVETYATDPGGTQFLADIAILQRDATCAAGPAEGAGAGRVILELVDGATYSGRFDFDAPNGDHLAGSFTTADCPALTAADLTAAVCH